MLHIAAPILEKDHRSLKLIHQAHCFLDHALDSLMIVPSLGIDQNVGEQVVMNLQIVKQIVDVSATMFIKAETNDFLKLQVGLRNERHNSLHEYLWLNELITELPIPH